MRVRLVCPERVGGIADYTGLLAAALTEAGVHVVDGPCDVVHVQWEPSLFARTHAAATLRLSRLLGRGRTVITFHAPPKHRPPARWRAHSIAHTAFTRDALLASGSPPERTHVVAHGVPVLDVPPPGGSSLLMLGYLMAHKGHSLALEALESLPAGYRLVVAGAPHPERPDATQAALRARASDRVELLGHVPAEDLPSLLGGASLVLAPYRDVELSASGAVARALGAGRGVVASDLPAFLELAEDSEALELFEAGSARGLAGAVLRADPHELGRRARSYAAANSFAQAARRTIAVYEQALS